MQSSYPKQAIFISYAWEPQSEQVVDKIQSESEKRGVSIVRDKKDLHYKGSITNFMEQLGRGKYVILVISNKYLRSENCMFELLQVFKNQDFYDRIFPVVLDEVKIAKAADRLDFIEYWEDEVEHLDNRIRELKNLANIQGVTEDLNLYTEIRNNISSLTHILKDINSLNVEKHISSSFSQLFAAVTAKMREDGHGSLPLKKAGIAALVVVVVVVGAVTLSQYLRNKRLPAAAKEATVSEKLPLEEDSTKGKATIIVDAPPKRPVVTYDVILVVPSTLAKEVVYVDEKPAEVVQRGLNTITVRLPKKNGSSHFKISKGAMRCTADRLVDKDSLKLAMLCN